MNGARRAGIAQAALEVVRMGQCQEDCRRGRRYACFVDTRCVNWRPVRPCDRSPIRSIPTELYDRGYVRQRNSSVEGFQNVKSAPVAKNAQAAEGVVRGGAAAKGLAAAIDVAPSHQTLGP